MLSFCIGLSSGTRSVARGRILFRLPTIEIAFLSEWKMTAEATILSHLFLMTTVTHHDDSYELVGWTCTKCSDSSSAGLRIISINSRLNMTAAYSWTRGTAAWKVSIWSNKNVKKKKKNFSVHRDKFALHIFRFLTNTGGILIEFTENFRSAMNIDDTADEIHSRHIDTILSKYVSKLIIFSLCFRTWILIYETYRK